MSERYYVSELEGFFRAQHGGSSNPGLSCMVIDRLTCCQVVATYRSEDHTGSRMRRLSEPRRLASEHAARLNA